MCRQFAPALSRFLAPQQRSPPEVLCVACTWLGECIHCLCPHLHVVSCPPCHFSSSDGDKRIRMKKQKGVCVCGWVGVGVGVYVYVYVYVSACGVV